MTQRLEGLRLTPLPGELGRNRLQIGDRTSRVADFPARTRGGHPRAHICGVERPKADHHLRRAALVAPSPPPFGDGVQVGTGVDQQPLARRNLGALNERVLVIGLEFEDFLVKRARLRQEAFGAETVGDARELLDRFVGLPGPDVEIAQGVGGIPVARMVLNDAEVL